jgi:hypothetical protein
MLLVVAALALTVLAFVFTNSGDAGVDNCNDQGFAGPGSLSWWPPGSVCRGGEPQREEVELGGEFVPVGLALLCAALFAGRRWGRVKQVADSR